jgi:hypothetical protein
MPAAPGLPQAGSGAAMPSMSMSDVEYVRSWVMASMMSSPLQEDVLARIGSCTPEDLPEIVEVLRLAEQICLTAMNHLSRHGRQLTDRQDPGRLGTVLYSGASCWWGGMLRWVQDACLCLEEEVERHEESLD